MSQPPYPYNRIFDFESFSINTPAAQQPGVQLEGEYDAVKRTIDSLISRLAEIQRDDGKLRGEAFDITTASEVYLEILALLQPTLALKANLASPALTGTPTAPTPATNSNNTAIATTAYVKAQGYATTSSLNNAIDGVESLVDAVNLRVNATNEEVTHKLDKRTGGSIVGDVLVSGNLGLNGFSSTLEFKYGNNPAITRLTKASIECLSGENGEGGYSVINSGLLAVAKSTIGFAQLQPNKISVSNQFGALSVELSSAGLKFLDGTLQSTASVAFNGGTINNDIVFPAVGTGSDSEIGAWGFGTENTTLGQTAYIEPNEIRIQDNTNTVGTALNGEGISFNDQTTQTTAALPLTGGTVTGNTTFGNGELPVDINVTGTLTVYNATTNYIGDGVQITDVGGGTYVYAGNLTMNLADSAKLSNLTHTQLRFEDGTTDITIDATGVKFPNQYFNSSLSRGSFDSGRSSYNGISLICTQGIELNWQAGYLKALSGTYVVPIYVEDSNLNFVSSGTTPNGINFTNTLPYGGETNTTTTSFDVNGITNSDSSTENDFSLSTNGVSGRKLDDLHFNLSGLGVSFGQQNSNYSYNADGISGENWSITKENGMVGIDFHGDITNNAIKEITDLGETTQYPVSASIVTSAENGISLQWLGGNGEFFDAGITLYNGVNTFTGTNNLTGTSNFTGKVNLNPAGTTTAPLNIKTGITPAGAVAGDIWIATDSFNYKNSSGATRTVATLSNNNPFTNYQSISVSNNANPALKITQLGSGEALRVEDETSPDATAFVVSNNGRVGIGVAPHATAALSIDGTGIKFPNVLVVPDRVIASPITSGNMSHSEYPSELLITINGVNYAIPLRVV
jgi:hypothetical protein